MNFRFDGYFMKVILPHGVEFFNGYFQRVIWQNFDREKKDGIIYGLSHVSKN